MLTSFIKWYEVGNSWDACSGEVVGGMVCKGMRLFSWVGLPHNTYTMKKRKILNKENIDVI